MTAAEYEIRRADTGEVIYKGGASRHAEFLNELLAIRAGGFEADGRYYVSGVEMTISDAIAAATTANENAYNQKCKTHRKVVYYTGACGGQAGNNRHEKWVRKP